MKSPASRAFPNFSSMMIWSGFTISHKKHPTFRGDTSPTLQNAMRQCLPVGLSTWRASTAKSGRWLMIASHIIHVEGIYTIFVRLWSQILYNFLYIIVYVSCQIIQYKFPAILHTTLAKLVRSWKKRGKGKTKLNYTRHFAWCFLGV